MASKPPIVFFGSGLVALASLRQLASDFELEAIITKPATERDMEAAFPNVPVYSAEKRAELDELIARQKFSSPLAILIDFGIIVSQTVIDIFPLGIVNSHFSLLPEWRGADPITFAILSGQKQTGVSLMLLTAGMDEGPLLAQVSYEIPERATTPELTDALIALSEQALKKIVPMYLTDQITPKPQPSIEPTYSRKLVKDDGLIDWHKPAITLEREIRAYIDWPKSRTTLAGREVIVTAAAADDRPGETGSVLLDGQRLFVGTSQGALEILKLKPAGKSEMGAKAFLAGYKQYL